MNWSSSSVRVRLGASLLAVTIVMVVFHITVSMRSVVDQWALALLLLAAMILAFAVRSVRFELRGEPALYLAFHVAAYLLVAGSIAVHAMTAASSVLAAAGMLWMVAGWGLGLLVHALSAVGDSVLRRPQV